MQNGEAVVDLVKSGGRLKMYRTYNTGAYENVGAGVEVFYTLEAPKPEFENLLNLTASAINGMMLTNIMVQGSRAYAWEVAHIDHDTHLGLTEEQVNHLSPYLNIHTIEVTYRRTLSPGNYTSAQGEASRWFNAPDNLNDLHPFMEGLWQVIREIVREQLTRLAPHRFNNYVSEEAEEETEETGNVWEKQKK